MRDAVICEPVRTPIGRYGGAFLSKTAADLASELLVRLIDRTQIDPGEIDEVILGNCYPSMEAPAIGRMVALDAGLPTSTAGYQLDRRCGSGLQAIINAVTQVGTGVSELVVAGGTESMSNVTFHSTDMRWGAGARGVTMHDGLARGRVTAGGHRHPVPGGMLETAENLRREYSITRVEQDELALESHRRAVEAQVTGVFGEEIEPISVTDRRGNVTVIESDEHPRPEISLDRLSQLKPVLRGTDSQATVTAGNASGQNDAAALCIVTTSQRAADLGLRPLARLVSWGVAGVEPARMGIGPVPAVAKALSLAGLSLDEIDLIELNEAFAAQVLACTREWGFTSADFERMNVHGSGISLGHPVGATGARIMTTLARELRRREGRFGLETMCIGGGQGLAAVIESLP